MVDELKLGGRGGGTGILEKEENGVLKVPGVPCLVSLSASTRRGSPLGADDLDNLQAEPALCRG